MKICLIVPTCRPERLWEFLRRWTHCRFWDDLVIVEDAPRRTLDAAGATVVAHADIAADLGEDAWIISRRSSAIRSYGFLIALRRGADAIVTLDDDCYPCEPWAMRGFGRVHTAVLFATPRWGELIPGLRTRGLPYLDRGPATPVALNVGLWTGVPDLDARTTLKAGSPTDFSPPPGSRLLSPAQYFPLSGMNMSFRREAAPLLYFGLHGEGWPYHRFDDIWMGVIAQKVCAHLGWSIAAGEPWVRHERASDPVRNLALERSGSDLNERFWRIVDRVEFEDGDARTCMDRIGLAFEGGEDDYLRTYGKALKLWARLVTEV